MLGEIQPGVSYLNASSSDDAHEEIGNDASHGHHQALHAGNASKQHEHEVDEVVPAWMKFHHEVDYNSWHYWYEEQERERW